MSRLVVDLLNRDGLQGKISPLGDIPRFLSMLADADAGSRDKAARRGFLVVQSADGFSPHGGTRSNPSPLRNAVDGGISVTRNGNARSKLPPLRPQHARTERREAPLDLYLEHLRNKRQR